MAKKINQGRRRRNSICINSKETKSFVVTDESKAKAKTFRILAIISWIVAIGFEIGAILLLRKAPVNTTLLIVLIVVDLIFAVIRLSALEKVKQT